MLTKIHLFCICGLFFSATTTFAQLNPQYDSIPVENNLKLAMTLYRPAGCTTCATILIQTPYNRLFYNLSLPLGIGLNIDAYAYNVVVVDWRGFYGSAGAAYAGAPTRGQDGYTAVEWIAAQPWSNGQVGTWGPSALGKCQYQTASYHPPHLVCMVPLVAAPQFNYLEYYPGGVYRTEYVEQLDVLGYGLSSFILANPYYNFMWQFSENYNDYPDSIRVPALMIGGWYDHNTDLMLSFFNGIRTNSPLPARDEHRLLMGPWAHGGSGTAHVGTSQQGELFYPNAEDWNDSLAWLFFDYHIRGINNGWNTSPFIQYYQMGDDTWQTSSIWPPTGVTHYNLYLHPDLSLSSALPTNAAGSLSYAYNPLDPSPTVGGCTLRSDLVQGPYNQDSLVESRNDILVFSTQVLTTDVVMKGKAEVHLKVSSDKKDTDFSVRLTDVYPDGRSELLVDGTARMRFRNGYSTADTASMIPGNIYDCVVDLPATCITFKAGHRIRVDISSSNYPKYNRNDNSGGIMYPGANGDSLLNPQTAMNVVYTNSTYPSYIVLPLESFINGLEESAVTHVSLFPNPAHHFTNLQMELLEGETMMLDITDLTGKMVMHQEPVYAAGQQVHTLDISGLKPGLYLVTLHGKNLHFTTRLVVQ
jgi:predicted acyl esterase